MPLHPGSRLGTFDIVGLVGEGGMGTVYRARDSRLGREVAIKIVRADLVGDPDRIARFEREARLLASLNHPHIATIHGLEEAAGTRFLVLELVEGLALNERLRQGPLPTREGLALALQIASAVESAHDRNIIHRDLKPANIKISPGGTVKVLDFGLAKALAADPAVSALAQSPTLAAGDTAVGVVVGTAAYMSPEQARGRDVDKRTDIWSFACVLFDMLTGRQAFAGDTVSDTLAAILTREPDWSLLPADLPPSIARLLRRCLEKDPHRRLRDIGDARFEIEEALAASSEFRKTAADGQPAITHGGPHASRRLLLVAAAALLAGTLLGASIVSWLRGTDGGGWPQPVRLSLELPEDRRLAGLDFQMIAIAPTDTHVAFVASERGRQQLFVKALAALDAEPLAGTDGALDPFFSPDGAWIAFFAAGKLKKVPVNGGPVRDIADADIGFGGAWSRDGSIVFAPSNASSLARVSADGGPVQAVTTLNTERGEFSHRWPVLSPDGRAVLFAVGTVGSWDEAEIAVQQLDGSGRHTIVRGGTFPRFLPDGDLLYAHGGMIHSMALDSRTYQSRAPAKPVLAEVLQSVDGAAQFATSPAGSIAYVPGGGGASGRTLVWVGRDGIPQPLAAPPRAYTAPRLAPDGRSVAVGIEGAPEQIWTYAISDNRLSPFTFDGGSSPSWSHDGARIFFGAARGGPLALFVKAVDDTTERRLAPGGNPRAPQSVSAAGAVLFVELKPETGRDVWVLNPDGSTRALLATPANESAPAFSPDGQLFAFVSDETGEPEVFVTRVAEPQRHVQVSTGGASEPVWRRDGTELFFRSGTRMMAAVVRSRPALTAGRPEMLFNEPFETGLGGSPDYDVSNDGMRFLMIKPPPVNRVGRELRIVLGWSSDLEGRTKARTPGLP